MAELNNIRDNESTSIKEYLNLLRNNLLPILVITLVSLVIAILYAVNSRDIYKSTTSLKVSKPQGSILNSPLMPEFQDFGNDRFIANEIEILKTFNTRERVAYALIDSFNVINSADSFYLIFTDKSRFDDEKSKLLSAQEIAEKLFYYSSIDQKRGLDIIEISAESPSPYEAALISNCYAKEYRHLNLEVNRDQLTFVKNFLLEQKNEKQRQLSEAEEGLRKFQEKGGIIALDEQASSLITQLSEFEAEKNAAEIELLSSDKVLNQYKTELENQNPRLADYLKSLSSEAYFKSLQEQLVRLEVNRDLALANRTPSENNSRLIADFDEKIVGLKKKLNEKVDQIKAGIYASSPEEVKELSRKIIVRSRAARARAARSTSAAAAARPSR